MTKLEDIKYACNVAAMEAIDAKLSELLEMDRKVWILDKHLPALLPAIEAAVERAMREVYDLMPESLNVDPAAVERTRIQLEQSVANWKKFGR